MSERAAILIVDDRPEKCLALEAVLEDLGQEIVRAYSGRDGLRQVLHREFAVILLDVNMPDMDGFETAAMIRQRKSSQDTPIIFVTAFGDEMHASRGYSLGAVDYILAPVLPEVLRTKVMVFVDLYEKTQQVRRQAESLRRRASQLQKLAASSVTINSALSLDRLLQTVTESAREVIACQQAITLFVDPRGGATQAFGSFTEKYADWRGRRLQLDALAGTIVAQSRAATRMTLEELHEHPDWEIVRQVDIPPIGRGIIAAPFCARDGKSLGVIYVTDRSDGPFTADDEAVLVQLAQMASTAIENTLFADEREANRLKDEFLATLSHELRTPLSSILGWTQLLRAGGDGATAKQGLEVIERNCKAQTKLIEDLLDVSRITTGKLRIAMKPTTLKPIVASAVDTVRLVAEAKGVQVEGTYTDEADAIVGDADRLQQVIWNLLTNALKFTPSGGRVRVSMEREFDQLRVEVSDTGQGIPASFLPYVFDRFRQADSSSTRSHGGLGIGLTIVRHIVELHGGSVQAHSEGDGRGSTFTIRLPYREVAAEVMPLSPVKPSLRLVSDAGEPALQGVYVLLVEDNDDAREMLREVLVRAGADVVAAGSAAEGLKAFRRRIPDVLASDIAMPDEDGFAFVRRIRSLTPSEGSLVPAIALTAYARDDDRARVLAAGFQRHVAKPISPDELIDTIGQVLTHSARRSRKVVDATASA